MQKAKRRRTTWAVAVSVVAHLAAGLAILLQHAPATTEPPIISVMLVSRPPPTSQVSTPRPPALRLHRPPQATPPPNAPTAPIAAPAPPGAVAPAPKGPVSLHPSPLPAGPKDELRTALRHGTVGCANRELVGLNKGERDYCDEQFGKGAKDAKFVGLGLSADKQRLLDAANARKEADYRYTHDPGTHAPIGRSRLPGITAEQMGSDMGNDRPVAKIPY